VGKRRLPVLQAKRPAGPAASHGRGVDEDEEEDEREFATTSAAPAL
jgi:hypothetical protein